MRISAFRGCSDSDLDALRARLGDRALGHDGPLALLRSAVDGLRRDRLLRPGLTVLERLVAAARTDAENEIHRRIGPALLTPRLEDALDELLVVPAGAAAAPVKQLGQETRSLGRIGEAIEKLELLRGLKAERWDLGMIPANRRRMLAQYVRHATSQAISRRNAAFRHPAMLAFCAEAAARVTDELVDLFDDGVGIQHAKARRALVKLKLDVADSANASVVLLGELLDVLLDPEIPDPQVRQAVWQRATPEELQLALDLAARSNGRWKTPTSSSSATATTPHASSRHASSPRCAYAPTPTAKRCSQPSNSSRTSTAAVHGACPTTRRSDSFHAAGGPTSIPRRAGSTAITGSCAFSASCAGRCVPVRSGCRAAAATPTPSAS
jgi:hypothetical protein